jgi:hypothetical protein
MNAMEVLGRIGDISCVPTLLEAAGNNDAKVAEAAKNALASLPDQGVDTVVRQRLEDATGQVRQVLIDVVGMRRIDAIPQLLKAADDSEQNIRAAALAALGSTVGPEDLSQLITRAVNAEYSRDSKAARKALHAASIRMPDRDACAAELTKAMSNAPVDVQCALVEVLASVGGQTALETVGQAAADDRAELKDVASESLGKWMTPDAAPVLLQLAQPQADEKYRIRALRGYIRIARQMKLTSAERAEMCELALKTATRDAERLLVLKVLEIHPSVDTLMVAVHAKKIPSIKEQAQQSVLTISQQIDNSDEVQKLLDQVDFTPADIEILNATYGVAGTTKDVTEILRKNVGKMPIVNLSSSSYNASFGGDPAPGVVKQLVVEYKINGLPGRTSFAENAMIILPMPAGGQ